MVPQGQVGRFWPLVRRHLIPAIARSGGRTDEPSVLEECGDGVSHLWMVLGDDQLCWGAFVTSFVQYPCFKVLSIQLYGAVELPRTLEAAHRTWERFAADTGCRRIEAYGRRGWKRVLEPYGWAERHVFLEKEVSHGHGQDAGNVPADHRDSGLGNGEVEPGSGSGPAARQQAA